MEILFHKKTPMLTCLAQQTYYAKRPEPLKSVKIDGSEDYSFGLTEDCWKQTTYKQWLHPTLTEMVQPLKRELRQRM